MKEQGDEQEVKPITTKEFCEQLTESVAMLIAQGHRDAWDYGYSFFIVACKAAVNVQKEQIKGMACAIGLAIGGKKAWSEFENGK